MVLAVPPLGLLWLICGERYAVRGPALPKRWQACGVQPTVHTHIYTQVVKSSLQVAQGLTALGEYAVGQQSNQTEEPQLVGTIFLTEILMSHGNERRNTRTRQLQVADHPRQGSNLK